jgi:hypothetical protein
MSIPADVLIFKVFKRLLFSSNKHGALSSSTYGGSSWNNISDKNQMLTQITQPKTSCDSFLRSDRNSEQGRYSQAHMVESKKWIFLASISSLP